MHFIYKAVLRCLFRLTTTILEGKSVSLYHAFSLGELFLLHDLEGLNMFIPQAVHIRLYKALIFQATVWVSWTPEFFARLTNSIVPGKRTGAGSQPAHVCCPAWASRVGEVWGLAHGHAPSHSLPLHILLI